MQKYPYNRFKSFQFATIPFLYLTRLDAEFNKNNCYMGTITIDVDTFYLNRVYYPYLPPSVFDALETAYLDGKETAELSEADYNTLLLNLKTADVCPELS